jgi:hypothetical protein
MLLVVCVCVVGYVFLHIRQQSNAKDTVTVARDAAAKRSLTRVRKLQQQYDVATTSVERAYIINKTLHIFTSSRSQELFDTIFTQPPFAQFNKGGNFAESIGALGEESYRLAPTVDAVVYTVWPDFTAITNLDRNYHLTSKERKEHAAVILAAMPKLQTGYSAEQVTAKDEDASVTLPMEFSFWSGYLYGVMARVDPAYIPQAQEHYRDVFSYYDKTRATDGTPLSSLEVHMPEYHISYALMLISVNRAGDGTEAADHVKAAVDMMKEHPSVHEQGYISFLRNLAASDSGFNTARLRSLGKVALVYPPFRDFAAQYGVKLH